MHVYSQSAPSLRGKFGPPDFLGSMAWQRTTVNFCTFDSLCASSTSRYRDSHGSIYPSIYYPADGQASGGRGQHAGIVFPLGRRRGVRGTGQKFLSREISRRSGTADANILLNLRYFCPLLKCGSAEPQKRAPPAQRSMWQPCSWLTMACLGF